MEHTNQVYILDTRALEDPAVFRAWYGRMPQARRDKIDRLRFDRDKRLSLGAGILLQTGLSAAGAGDAALFYGEHGKPFLKDAPGVHFSLSHSGYLAVCAVSDRPVGADVEAERHFEDKLLRYVFREDEIALVRRCAADADRGFTELWTVKESVMKYFGTGLSLPPKKLHIDLCGPLRAACAGYPCAPLRFTRYAVDGHGLTVCSEYEGFSPGPEWVSP